MSNSKKPTFEEIKFGHFLIKIGSEQTYEDAVASAKSVVTNINQERTKARVIGIPTADEFAEALSQISPTDLQ